MIAVVDSGVANLTSVMAALQRIGADAVVTADPDKIKRADRVILPGVGAAGAAMAKLKERNLAEVLRGLTQPVLGICLGMQLLFENSTEGDVRCLGIIPGTVSKLPDDNGLPIPHMGWNQISVNRGNCSLLRGVEDGSYVYFVHSYAARVSDATIATAEYGAKFSAAVNWRNFFGCQFHPERSSAVGSRILQNFMEI